LGKKDVNAALDKLDDLTKEETSMAVAMNLEVTSHVQNQILGIESAIKHAVRVLEERTQWFPTAFVHILILCPIVHKTGLERIQCLFLWGTIIGLQC
jgi:hypothetical protein